MVCLSCVDLNLCRLNPCLNGGICTESRGVLECLCPPQYSGTHCQTGALHYTVHTVYIRLDETFVQTLACLCIYVCNHMSVCVQRCLTVNIRTEGVCITAVSQSRRQVSCAAAQTVISSMKTDAAAIHQVQTQTCASNAIPLKSFN